MWTDKLPTDEGYYWFYKEDKPQIVLVYKWRGVLQCTVFGDQDGWSLDHSEWENGYWYGPLTPPKVIQL